MGGDCSTYGCVEEVWLDNSSSRLPKWYRIALEVTGYHWHEEKEPPVSDPRRRLMCTSQPGNLVIISIEPPMNVLDWEKVKVSYIRFLVSTTTSYQDPARPSSLVCGAQWLNPQGRPTSGSVFPVENCCPSVNVPAVCRIMWDFWYVEYMCKYWTSPSKFTSSSGFSMAESKGRKISRANVNKDKLHDMNGLKSTRLVEDLPVRVSQFLMAFIVSWQKSAQSEVNFYRSSTGTSHSDTQGIYGHIYIYSEESSHTQSSRDTTQYKRENRRLPTTARYVDIHTID